MINVKKISGKLLKAVSTFGLYVFILFFFLIPNLQSQDIQSDLSGFSASLDLHYSQWNTSGEFIKALRDLDPNGVGAKISANYGFNQRIEAFLSFAYSDFNRSGDWSKYYHSEFGLGIRHNFGATLSKLRPFVDGSINSSTMIIDRVLVGAPGSGIEGEFEMTGFTIGLGAGTRYFFRPYLAANVHARVHFGSDYDLALDGNTLDVNESQDLTQWNIGAGVIWYFGKKF